MNTYFLGFVAMAILPLAMSATKEEMLKYVYEVGMKCAEKVKATHEEAMSLKDGNLPETEAGKCLLDCLHKELKLVDDNGMLVKDGTLAGLEHLKDIGQDVYDNYHKIFLYCLENLKPLGNNCDNARAIMECSKNQEKSMGIDKSVFLA